MEEEKKVEPKKGKNILERIDRGTFLEEKRKVFRSGMEKETIYILKIPKTIESATSLYGKESVSYTHLTLPTNREV